MVISCSFLEVGQAFLADSSSWMTPAIIRSSVMHSIEGGWSRCLSLFLHHLLKGPLGFSTAGVAVELGGEVVVIYATLSVMLTDGEGWHVVGRLGGSTMAFRSHRGVV